MGKQANVCTLEASDLNQFYLELCLGGCNNGQI